MNTLQSCSFLCLALAAWSFASQAVWLSRMALAVPFCVSILQCIKPDGPENLAERLRQELVYGWMVCWHESTGIHRSNSRFRFHQFTFFCIHLGPDLGWWSMSSKAIGNYFDGRVMCAHAVDVSEGSGSTTSSVAKGRDSRSECRNLALTDESKNAFKYSLILCIQPPCLEYSIL